MDFDLTEVTAYHEAGHAVMAVVLGAKVIHASIEPPDDDGLARTGESIVQWPAGNAQAIEAAEMKVSLAGPVVERIYTGDVREICEIPEFAADWSRATQSSQSLTSSITQCAQLLRQTEASIRDFFDDDNHWAAIGATADELLAHETIEHITLVNVVSFWIKSVK